MYELDLAPFMGARSSSCEVYSCEDVIILYPVNEFALAEGMQEYASEAR
jgi:hypothetical protein